MRVLLTGAGGFNGSVVAKELLSRGHSVFALAGRRSMGRLSEKAGHERGALTVLFGDLSDDAFKLPDGIEAIIHTAASSPATGVTALQMSRDNVVATARLVRHAVEQRIDSFVYYSSLSVYGRIEAEIVEPSTPMVDPDTYGLTKRLGEVLIEDAAGSFRSVAIRLPGVLGAASVRNWMTGVLAAARQNQDIPIFNATASFNNAVHVRELACFTSDLLESKSWTGFNPLTLGACGTVTVEQAVRLIVEAYGNRAKIIVKGERNPCYVISSQAALAFGYAPSNIEDLLRRFIVENYALPN